MPHANPVVVRDEQTSKAVETYTVDCTNDLPTGAAVDTTASNHTATHTGPGGSISATATVSGNKVSFAGIGPLTVEGVHKVELLISYTSAGGLKRGVLLLITVPPGIA